MSSPVNEHDAANKAYVVENTAVSRNGDTMPIGDLNMNNVRLTGLQSSMPETGGDGRERYNWSEARKQTKCASKVSKIYIYIHKNLYSAKIVERI